MQEVVQTILEKKVKEDCERVGLGKSFTEAGRVCVEERGDKLGESQPGPAQGDLQEASSGGDGRLVGRRAQEGGELGQAGDERLDSGGQVLSEEFCLF